MDNLMAKLFGSKRTVFTSKDLAVIWGENRPSNLKAKVAYYVKEGALVRITRGIFSLSQGCDLKELAGKIYTPSYMSFETVLRESGVIFQHYESIFLAGKWTKTVVLNGQDFVFRKLKDIILYNPSGVLLDGNYNIATTERAFLDMLYLFPNYYFDNLRPINWKKCSNLLPLYRDKALLKRFKKYKSYAE